MKDVTPFFQHLLTMVGAPTEPVAVSVFDLLFARRQLAGSLIGGIAETREMLNFCGQHGITCDIEMIPISKINEPTIAS